MKDLIKQFYSEGLAVIFYIKPINFLKKRIKNKTILNILTTMIKILYTILAISFASYILYKKLL